MSSHVIEFELFRYRASVVEGLVRSAVRHTGDVSVRGSIGASGIGLYIDALRRIDTNAGWLGRLDFKKLILPKNVGAPDITTASRQRLMAAHGLSFSQLDYVYLIPPSQIPEPESVKGRNGPQEIYVSKDML